MRKGKRSSDKQREVTVEIDMLTVVSVALIIVMGVILLFSIINLFKGFIGVRKFEVVGDSPYLASEIAAGAGIKKGDKLYRLDKNEVEKAILLNCPYIEKVNIKTSFPNKIKFEVECYKPIWYIEISGDFYVLDQELRVLEETRNKERLYDSGITGLTLPNVKTAMVGETLVFGSSDVETEATLKIMETILSSPIYEMVSSADIDNRYDIHFELDTLPGGTELDGRFFVNVGGYSKLEAKLEYIVRAIIKENLEGAVGGTIDVSENGDRVSIRPIYVNDGTEETTGVQEPTE